MATLSDTRVTTRFSITLGTLLWPPMPKTSSHEGNTCTQYNTQNRPAKGGCQYSVYHVWAAHVAWGCLHYCQIKFLLPRLLSRCVQEIGFHCKENRPCHKFLVQFGHSGDIMRHLQAHCSCPQKMKILLNPPRQRPQ